MDYLGNFETDTTADIYQLVGGLRSDFQVKGNDWNWSVYASHGNTNVNAYQPEGFPYLPRMQNLFNANQYGLNFDVSSLPGYVPVAVTGHCTSGLPIFNPNGSVNNTPSVSQDCSDYAVLRMNSVTTLEQNIFEGTVTGTIAEHEVRSAAVRGRRRLPEGDLRVPAGLGLQREPGLPERHPERPYCRSRSMARPT